MPNTDTYPLLFELPPIQEAAIRRRSRSLPIIDENITSRQARIQKRNRTMVARYYYWTELQRRRFDDVLRILSDNEFFVEERTISNALLEYDDFFRELCDQKMTSRKLKRMFPGWEW